MRRPRTIVLILTLLIVLIIELVFLPMIEIGGRRPDIFLIAVCFFGLQYGVTVGFAFGLASGFLKDCFSQGLVGGFSFSLGLVGLIVAHQRRLIYRESAFTQMFVTFLASVVYLFLYQLLLRLYQPIDSLESSFRWIIFPSSVYTAIMALPIFLLLQKIFGFSEEL